MPSIDRARMGTFYFLSAAFLWWRTEKLQDLKGRELSKTVDQLALIVHVDHIGWSRARAGAGSDRADDDARCVFVVFSNFATLSANSWPFFFASSAPQAAGFWASSFHLVLYWPL